MARQYDLKKVYMILILITCLIMLKVLHYYSTRETVFRELDNKIVLHSNNEYNCELSSSSDTNKSKALKKEILKNNEPSSLMEQTRRHVHQTVKEQWLFLKQQIQTLKQLEISSGKNQHKYHTILDYMYQHTSDYYRIINIELKKLSQLDGWDAWRWNEAFSLKNIIYKRLKKLQNPKNCTTAQTLICNLTNPYGFASGVHDVLWCFIKAYYENKRLILLTSQWHYAPNGWETLFQPLSKTCCPEKESQKSSQWPGENSNKARWLMRTLPQDLGPKIIRLHGNPLAWWYGQFLNYLMRPNVHLNSLLESIKKKINYSLPFVGVHVRRTDKIGTEAKSHKLEEYMEYVEDYFLSIELTSQGNAKRRVYIATDDPEVIKECQTKFHSYECLYYPGSAETASNMETRYSNSSLWSLVADIFMLASADFLVCTLSSGLCRLAYELKQAQENKLPDNSKEVISLDIPHHYAWVIPASRKGIYNHKAKSPKELNFQKDDIFIHKNEFCTVNAAIKGKVSNGLIKMINTKNSIIEGLIPLYKTREMFQMVNLPKTKNINELMIK